MLEGKQSILRVVSTQVSEVIGLLSLISACLLLKSLLNRHHIVFFILFFSERFTAKGGRKNIDNKKGTFVYVFRTNLPNNKSL